LDRVGRLVAHPDISLVLRGADNAAIAPLGALQKSAAAQSNEIVSGFNAGNRPVLAAAAGIPDPDWTAFVEQPTAEAYGPIRAALWRTGLL
jgi:adenylate cyclase